MRYYDMVKPYTQTWHITGDDALLICCKRRLGAIQDADAD